MGLYDRDWYSDLHREREETSSQITTAPALVQITAPEQLTATTQHGDKSTVILASTAQVLPDKRNQIDHCPKCGFYNPNRNALCFQCGHIDWGWLFYVTGFAATCLAGAVLGYLNLPGTIWPNLVGYGLGFFGFVLVCLTTGEWIAVVSSNRNNHRSAAKAATLDRSH